MPVHCITKYEMYWIISIFSPILVIINAERIRYISTEHPNVTYYNPKYVSYANLTSQRYGRGDIFYYVGLHMHFVSTFSNNVSVHFYFYEYLSNRYQRGFVEMHFTFCDLMEKDQFFGTALRQGKFAQPCPYGPGAYNLYNMTIPLKHIPHNFPFKKGRIYCNLTGTTNKEFVGSGYIDMEIKEANLNRKRPKN